MKNKSLNFMLVFFGLNLPIFPNFSKFKEVFNKESLKYNFPQETAIVFRPQDSLVQLVFALVKDTESNNNSLAPCQQTEQPDKQQKNNNEQDATAKLFLSQEKQYFFVVNLFLENDLLFGRCYLLDEKRIQCYDSGKKSIAEIYQEALSLPVGWFVTFLESNTSTSDPANLKDSELPSSTSSLITDLSNLITDLSNFLAKGQVEEIKNRFLAENNNDLAEKLEKKEQKILQLRQEKKEQQEVSENKLTELRKELKEQKQAFEKQQKENQLKFEKKLEECFQKLLDEKDKRLLDLCKIKQN